MNPKELRKFNELTKMSEKVFNFLILILFEDVDTSHPLIKEFNDLEEFPPELIKKGDDAMDEFLRKKNKEMIRITLIAV